jgi:hypothetical protein
LESNLDANLHAGAALGGTAGASVERMPVAGPPSQDPAELEELVSDAIVQARELLRAELALARQELRDEAAAVKMRVGAGVLGLLLVQAAIIWLAGALAFTIGTGAMAAAAVGGLLLLFGAAALGYAQGMFSRSPMARTRARLLHGKEPQRGN